jgi:hypothetical protein
VHQGDHPGAGPALSDADTAAGRQQVLLFPFWLRRKEPVWLRESRPERKDKTQWG